MHVTSWQLTLSLTVTVVEVLPKDKKGKEEKINVLGQSCIDLLPLLHGKDLIVALDFLSVLKAYNVFQQKHY